MAIDFTTATMTARDAARALGVDVATIRRWIRAGKLGAPSEGMRRPYVDDVIRLADDVAERRTAADALDLAAEEMERRAASLRVAAEHLRTRQGVA